MRKTIKFFIVKEMMDLTQNKYEEGKTKYAIMSALRSQHFQVLWNWHICVVVKWQSA